MVCLFCKQNSSDSKSIEHIIPESLGNVYHILPKGIVCDKCNNYFSVKIEKPLLEQPYFRNLRFRNDIKTKRGNRVVENAILFNNDLKQMRKIRVNGQSIVIDRKEDYEMLVSKSRGSLLILDFREPEKENYLLSRFLAKTALESLVYLDYGCKEWIKEINNKEELDSLREYARFGKGKFWNFHQRRIYREEDRFYDSIYCPKPYEILHEFKFLHLENEYLYFVLVIMGIEYVINLGGSELDRYLNWLEMNEGISPIRRDSEYKILKKL